MPIRSDVSDIHLLASARVRTIAGIAGIAVVACALFASAANAQEDDAPTPPPETRRPSLPEGVEVIRVRGKTVKAIETEVPSSVTQFDPATIAALGAQNVSDLAKVTPNVEIRTSGATTATFFIRGVGLSDFNANAAGAVAIYQDDVAMNSPALQLGQLFDLADVQVLRGPQGSGAGRNASAGAIKIASRKPTGEFSASLRADLSNSSEDPRTGALFGGRDFEGALQVPLVEDVLSSRFAFRFTQKDPFRKNGCSTRYVPTQAEREANFLDWVGVRVCGTSPDRVAFDNPSPPPQRVRISLVDPVEGHHKVNDTDNWAARGQLRFQPPPGDDLRMDFLLNAHGSRLDQLSTLGQAIGTVDGFGGRTTGNYREPDHAEMEQRLLDQGMPLLEARQVLGRRLARHLDIRPYRGDYNRIGRTQLDTWGAFLRGDFEFDESLELTSITGFDTYTRKRESDQDFTPLQLFEAIQDDDAWQFTQDLRLSGESEEETLRWQLGGFYLQEQIHSENSQFFSPLSPTVAVSIYDQNLWSFGAYAGFEWDFLEDFTLELGGRYNWEKKDFDFTTFRDPNSRTQVEERVWQAPTGTLSLTYRFSPEVSVYSKLSRGWKGGHFNASANVITATAPAKPETITAVETGFRARLFDGRLDLTGDIFYYRYEEYQVFVFENLANSPPTLQIINANDAELLGAELGVVARPLEDLVPDLLDGFRIETTVGWLRSEFLDFTNTRTTVIMGVPAVATVDFTGNPLINSPDWKVSISAEAPLDLGRFGTVTPRYDGVWTDDIFFDATGGRGVPNVEGEITLPDYALGQIAHWIHNVRLAYRTPGDGMEFAAWVRNIEDLVVKTYAFDASRFGGVIVNFVGEPRTYGFSFSFRF